MLIGPGESESEFELNLYLLKKEPGLRPGEEFTQQTVRSLTDPHPALRWLTVWWWSQPQICSCDLSLGKAYGHVTLHDVESVQHNTVCQPKNNPKELKSLFSLSK